MSASVHPKRLGWQGGRGRLHHLSALSYTAARYERVHITPLSCVGKWKYSVR